MASLRKVKKRGLKTQAQRAPGFWRRALPEDGDIETQPGPSRSVRKLKLGSLNCAGAGSAFGALADFVVDRVDVFGLQEAQLSPRQAYKWQQVAKSHGYKATRLGSSGASGPLTPLVVPITTMGWRLQSSRICRHLSLLLELMSLVSFCLLWSLCWLCVATS